jgi:hypothetical protein
MKTILTPIDFSSVSDAVVMEAAALAKAVIAGQSPARTSSAGVTHDPPTIGQLGSFR